MSKREKVHYFKIVSVQAKWGLSHTESKTTSGMLAAAGRERFFLAREFGLRTATGCATHTRPPFDKEKI